MSIDDESKANNSSQEGNSSHPDSGILRNKTTQHNKNSQQDNSKDKASQLKFLNRLYGITHNASSSDDSLSDVGLLNDHDLLNALNALASAEIVGQLFTLIDQQLKQQVSQQNNKLKQYATTVNLVKTLAQSDAEFVNNLPKPLIDCLEIINQLFNSICQNPYLDVECKTAISRLNLSFCKLALSDSRLLLETEHPARQFINQMINISLLWNKDDPKTLQILNQVNLAVNKVIELAANGDIKVAFNDAYSQLEGFASNTFKRIEIFEKRIYEAEQGKAKAELAKQQARQQLVNLCANLDIPAFVVKFFHTAWEHLLFLEQLKSQSDNNSEALFAAKQLLVSLYPKNNIEAQQKLEALLLQLQPYLEQKLTHSCYTSEQAASFLLELKQHHQKTLVATKLNVEESGKETIIRLKPNQPLAFESDDAEQEQEVENIEDMSLNQWVDFDYQQLNTTDSNNRQQQITTDTAKTAADDKLEQSAIKGQLIINQLFEIKQKGHWQLAKYIGHIKLTADYIFADLSGNKLAQFNSSELVDQFQQKKLQAYEKQAAFDKALNKVQLDTYQSDLRLKQKQQTQINIEAELKRIEELKQAKQAQIKAEQQRIKAEHEARIKQQKQQAQIQVEDVTQLAIGSRVELNINNNFISCKLAAKIASNGQYIFVDRSGVKVKQCSADELKQLIELGQIKLKQQLEANDDAIASAISRARRSKA